MRHHEREERAFIRDHRILINISRTSRAVPCKLKLTSGIGGSKRSTHVKSLDASARDHDIPVGIEVLAKSSVNAHGYISSDHQAEVRIVRDIIGKFCHHRKRTRLRAVTPVRASGLGNITVRTRYGPVLDEIRLIICNGLNTVPAAEP